MYWDGTDCFFLFFIKHLYPGYPTRLLDSDATGGLIISQAVCVCGGGGGGGCPGHRLGWRSKLDVAVTYGGP